MALLEADKRYRAYLRGMVRYCFDGWRVRHKKSIKGFGESSAHWFIAQVAVETGISPRELMELEPRMLWTIHRYLVSKSQH